MTTNNTQPDGNRILLLLTAEQRSELSVLCVVLRNDAGIASDARKTEADFAYAIFKLGLKQVRDSNQLNLASGATESLSVQFVQGTLLRLRGRQVLGVVVTKKPQVLLDWFVGESKPSAADEHRLRDAYSVYSVLVGLDGDYTIRAWFMGIDPQLEDTCPAEARARDRISEVSRRPRIRQRRLRYRSGSVLARSRLGALGALVAERLSRLPRPLSNRGRTQC